MDKYSLFKPVLVTYTPFVAYCEGHVLYLLLNGHFAVCSLLCCYTRVFTVQTCFCARSILRFSLDEIIFNQFYTNILPADNWV